MKKMKKPFSVVLVVILLLIAVIAGIATCNKARRQNIDTETSLNQTITPQEAEKLCYTVLGEQDKETGFLFSFGYTETIEKDGKEYYAIRASWLVNNSHMSYIGDYFVSVDGNEIYTGNVNNDGYEFDKLIWNK